ncbi:metallopeptidase TldD-related protein [Nostocoides sp. Soil756]|uniref:TldD/PmbA family protein n=1 Tax=Nostocoides sp. Soil756 TaxID=1736399 RepID=UPI0006FD9510|nr:metallopeptidase TldD-related protein [Tetrasphaera sp. Soil756]KRE60796.1 hypothetical protein ASG78_10425 [Tetrasphaera sp. Soil756]
MSAPDRSTGASPLRAAVGRDRALSACHAAVASALAAGADQASAFLAARNAGYTRFAQNRVHQPQDICEWTLMVRAEVDGRASRVATTDLQAASTIGERATERARALAVAYGHLPALRVVAAAEADDHDASLWLEDTAAWDTGARTAAARATMAEADRAGGAAYGMYGHAATELATVTAQGVSRYARATEAVGGLTVRIGDGTSHWTDVDRSLGVLDLEAAAARTVREAHAGQHRVDLPDGTYDVVLGPLATGALLERIAAFGFTGEAVADGVGAVARRPGELVAATAVDVADDPGAPRGLPFPFDLEGTTSVRVPLLDQGRVAQAVTDLASAARSGLAPTGHAHIAREETPHAVPASITMAGGATEDLLAGVERGLYVQRLWYLNVIDPETTTLTGGSRDACFLVEEGRLAQPVAPARFSESVFGALARVDAIGSEILAQPLMNVWNGCVSAPAVRVRGFRFGGAT